MIGFLGGLIFIGGLLTWSAWLDEQTLLRFVVWAVACPLAIWALAAL